MAAAPSPRGAKIDVRSMTALEVALSEAPVIGLEVLKNETAHHDQHRFWLGGGIVAQAKPAHGLDYEGLDGDRAIRNEVAAWRVAREMRWVDLVPAAVLRELPNLHAPEGGEELCSLQVVLHDVEDDMETTFDDEDVTRAAILDYLVWQPDRKFRNWLLTGHRFFSSRRLMLIDHGFCFGYRDLPLGSRFFDVRVGRDLNQDHIEAIRNLSENIHVLAEILPSEAVDDVAARAQFLLNERRLSREDELTPRGAGA